MDLEYWSLSVFVQILLIGSLDISCVKINQLLVPEIASPSASPVILDCDYSLEFPKDEGLVVKWFFNERVYPVYQWIPDAKPQELGILKGRLDLNYRASEDRHKVHRALKIRKVGPELVGNYTCSVSTFSSEDSQTKKMLVFVPEKSLELKYPPLWYRTEKDLKILCYAEDVFPNPELRLFLNNSQVENATIRYQEGSDGLFDAEIFITVDNLVDGTSILCELHIAMTNYTVRKEAVYYQALNPSSAEASRNYWQSFWIILSVIFNILD